MKSTILMYVLSLALTACGTTNSSVDGGAVSSSSVDNPSIESVEFKNVVVREIAAGVDLVPGDVIVIHGLRLGNSVSRVCATDGNSAHDYCLSGLTVVDSQEQTLTLTLSSSLRAPFGTGMAVISAVGRGSNIPSDGVIRNF